MLPCANGIDRFTYQALQIGKTPPYVIQSLFNNIIEMTEDEYFIKWL